MEAVFAGHRRNIQNLNGPQKLEIFPGTSQAKWKTSEMVFEAARLRFYTMTHSRENEHQSRHSFKKRSS